MKKAFFDTWAWVAIAHRNDTHHSNVVSFYERFLIDKGNPVTTDYILSETITLLRAKTDSKGTAVFIDTILAAAGEDRVMLERINEKRWARAWELNKKYDDKPYISFVDFSSFVVMKELGISNVVTADKHFEEIGLGFKKLF